MTVEVRALRRDELQSAAQVLGRGMRANPVKVVAEADVLGVPNWFMARSP